jgi:NAD(P)H-dependent FMN reductase
MLDIAIIAGSTRPGRHARVVADWLLEVTRERGDARFEIVDLADHDLPLLDEALPPSAGQYSQPHTRAWAATIEPFDGFVFVTPEYNRAPPAALKNAIDFLYAEWHDKAAGFVAYGSHGGTRAVEQLRLIMGELQIADVRDQVALSLFDDFVDFTALDPRPSQTRAAHAMLDQVVAWSQAMKDVRLGREAARDVETRPVVAAAS